MALPMADDYNGGQFTTHYVVDTHVRGKALSVVYTNDLVSVESSIQTMEQFLADDKFLAKRDPTFFLFLVHMLIGLKKVYLITF